MHPPDGDSHTKLPSEESQEFNKFSPENLPFFAKSGLFTKFRDVLPEALYLFFDKRESLFGNPFRQEDFTILHEILGSPSMTNDSNPYRCYEGFYDLQVEDFIKLIKMFTIKFFDVSTKPWLSIEEHKRRFNTMEATIYQRNLIPDITQIMETLPHFILEPPNLFTQMVNDSGQRDHPNPYHPSSWDHPWNDHFRYLIRQVRCAFSRISADRYRLHIATPQQFILLLKSGELIYSYDPQTDVTSLIWSNLLKNPDV